MLVWEKETKLFLWYLWFLCFGFLKQGLPHIAQTGLELSVAYAGLKPTAHLLQVAMPGFLSKPEEAHTEAALYHASPTTTLAKSFHWWVLSLKWVDIFKSSYLQKYVISQT